MTRVFADTFFFLALLNRADEAHERAVAFARAETRPLITSEWILTELGDAFCAPQARKQFLQLLHVLSTDGTTEVIPSSHERFTQGVELFRDRPDKDWSLTDCISFGIMREHGIIDALTGDRHFEQAGFNPLLK